MVFIFSAARLGDFTEIVSVWTINVFGGGKDEHRVRLHLAQQVHRTFDVRAKAILSVGWALAQLSSEVDYDVVDSGPRGIERAKHVEV